MLNEHELMIYVTKFHDEFIEDFFSNVCGMYGDMENLLPRDMNPYDKIAIVTTTLIQFYSLHVSKIITPLSAEGRTNILEKFLEATEMNAKSNEKEYLEFCREEMERRNERRQ